MHEHRVRVRKGTKCELIAPGLRAAHPRQIRLELVLVEHEAIVGTLPGYVLHHCMPDGEVVLLVPI